jgi:hypothetical protein
MAAPDAQLAGNWRLVRQRLLVIALALALGGVAYLALGDYLTSLSSLAETDVVAARAKLAVVFQALALGLFPLTGGLGVFLVAACRKSFALDRFPPPGAWGFGATRVFTGAAARRVAFAMLVLAIALVLCSIAGAALSWVMAERLLACRAA